MARSCPPNPQLAVRQRRTRAQPIRLNRDAQASVLAQFVHALRTAMAREIVGAADYSRFQRADRLANRRWSYPKFRGRLTEIAVLANA